MGLSHLFYPWGFVLQILALVHFFRRRPDSYWFYVILFFGALGSAIYFLAEVVPDFGLLRDSFTRAARRRRVKELEAIVEENSAVGNLEELADLSFDEGQWARARELYDKLLKISRPVSVDPFYRRGLSALALDDAVGAVPDLEKVVADEPKYGFYRATGMLATAYAQAGLADKADAQFRSATGISTLSETYFNYATFLVDQQRPAEAREWAQRIVDKTRTLPRFAKRQERPWVQKARALLKKLN